MSRIDDYFGFNEPDKKVETKKEEKSIQERVNSLSEGFSLGKSAEYFEEAYKQVVPEAEPEVITEEVLVETTGPDLSELSIEELEALAEQKTQEIEIEQIAEIGKQSLTFEYKTDPNAEILESVDSYRSALDRVNIQEPEELIDPEQFRLTEMERKITALANSFEGVKGYIKEGTLVSGIGQGGDGQLPGGGEVLLRGLDDVNIGNIQDGETLVWDESEGQFLPGAGGGGTSGAFLPLDGSEPMTGPVEVIFDTQNPINRSKPAISVKTSATATDEFAIDYQGAFIRDFADPSFEYVPPTRNYLANKGYVDDEIRNAQIGGLFNFKGAVDATVDDPTQPIDTGDTYVHTGPDGQTTSAWGSLAIQTGDYLVFEGRDWQIHHLDGDVFVKKTGDTMTGALKLETAGGQPLTISGDSEAVNLKHLADNYLDRSGGNIHGDIEFQGYMTEQEGIDNQDKDYDGRYVDFVTKIPYLTDKGYQESSGNRKPFGIRFQLHDGNTYMNTVGFNNRNGRFMSITGGVDPAIKFEQNISGSNYTGVRITGIPMPHAADGASVAIPRGYVDNNFIGVTGGQLTGQLEVMSPSAFISHNIDYQNTNSPIDGATLFDVIDVSDDTEKFKMSAFRYLRNSTGKDVHTVNQQIYYSPAKNEDGEYWFRIRDTDTSTSQSLLILRSDKADFLTNIDMHYNHVEYLSDPTDDHQAATKNYVDNKVSGIGGSYLNLAGGTMAGAINMGGQEIVNVKDPISDQDVTTKRYVDTLRSANNSASKLHAENEAKEAAYLGLFGRHFKWSGSSRTLNAGEFWIADLATSDEVVFHTEDLDTLKWGLPTNVVNATPTPIPGALMTINIITGTRDSTCCLVRKVKSVSHVAPNEYTFQFEDVDSVIFDSSTTLDQTTSYYVKMSPFWG